MCVLRLAERSRPKDCALELIARQRGFETQVLISLHGADSPSRCPANKSLLHQKRLIGVFNSSGLFADGLCERRETHRMSRKPNTEDFENHAVYLIEASFIDPKER